MQNSTSNVPEFSQGWAAVIDFLPKAFAFLVTILVGWYVAKFVANLSIKGLRRLGLEHYIERAGIRQALADNGWTAAELCAKLVFFTVYLFVLQFAFGFFGPNPISAILTRVIAYLPNVFVALAIVGMGIYLGAIVRAVMVGSLGRLDYGRTSAVTVYGGIVALSMFAALNQLNIAPEIVTGLFYALLAIVVGSTIVAVGGGGIVPMRAVWDRAIRGVEREAPRVREELEPAGEKLRVVQKGPFTA